MPTNSPLSRTPSGERLTELIGEVFRLNAALIQIGNELTEPFGLTSARWQLLAALSLGSEIVTVSELARKMKLTRQSVQRIVNELIAEEILEMIDNPNDQRAKRIWFTSSGREVLEQVDRSHASWVNALSDTIDEQSILLASDLLRHVRSNLSDPEIS